MKAQIRNVIDGDKKYQVLVFMCPGCEFMMEGAGLHRLPVNANGVSPSWDWDGNLEAPTLSPSILTKYEWGPQKEERRCHSYLRNGVFEFLGDCTHSLKNQHVPMKDLPEQYIKPEQETNG